MARPASAAGHGRVRIRKRGKFWYARWIDGVTRHEINLELTNKKNAEDKAKEIDDALERGEPWVSGRDRSVVTFAQVVEEYLNKGSRWSENTRRGTKSVLNQLVAEFGSSGYWRNCRNPLNESSWPPLRLGCGALSLNVSSGRTWTW